MQDFVCYTAIFTATKTQKNNNELINFLISLNGNETDKAL